MPHIKRGDEEPASIVQPKQKFLSRAAILMSGTVIAQAITILTSLAVTRLYDASEYGRYSIFVACGVVLGPLATGAFDKLILFANSEATVHGAKGLIGAISVMVALSIVLSFLILKIADIQTPLSLKAVDWMVLLPLFVILSSAGRIFINCSLRRAKMRQIAGFKVGQSVVAGFVQVSLSGVKDIPGLIVGYMSGLMVLASGYILSRQRRQGGGQSKLLNLKRLLATARHYRRYPKYLMPNEVVDGLSNQAPLFLIGTYASAEAAGYFSLAVMVLSAPTALVGQAMAQTFLHYISQEQSHPALLRRSMIRIWIGMFFLGVLGFSPIFMFGEDLFQLVFGESWGAAGTLASAMTIMLLMRFASSPTSGIYLKLNLQRLQWYFVLLAAAYRIGSYAPLAVGVDLVTCIKIHSFAEILAIVAYNATAVYRLNKKVVG